jgi:hypothetical protein
MTPAGAPGRLAGSGTHEGGSLPPWFFWLLLRSTDHRFSTPICVGSQVATSENRPHPAPLDRHATVTATRD